ncbi:MAG TPA: hypothetical protein VNM40_02775 [Candidatus Paceibacterota bacterium]|nr:hypothetical protein [Candidatus Paceibacterota bacterium]
MTTINRILLLAVVLGVFATVVRLTDFFGSTPFKETYEEEQLDALVAMARADTIGEKVEYRCRAQQLVVDVALRVRKKYPGLTFVQMLQTGKTFYPDGWVHRQTFIGRYTLAIYWSIWYWGSPWNDVKQCVLNQLDKGLDGARCAEKYDRANKRYSSSTDEVEAAKVIAKTMKVDPKQPPELIMKFYCP